MNSSENVMSTRETNVVFLQNNKHFLFPTFSTLLDAGEP